MTELSFLLDLLFNHKLPKTAKDVIAARIKEVEEKLNENKDIHIPFGTTRIATTNIPNQSPSTLIALAKHGVIPLQEMPPIPKPEPVQVIAQTAATQAAMNSRNEAINRALSGKPLAGQDKPRKW